jgi:SAM-dependent methyltransferase
VDTETGPTWSDIAGWYDELIERGSGAHETALRCLLDLVPPGALTGATVLDLACGTGLASRALAARGAAQVLGVDSSPEMIERARGHPAPAGETEAGGSTGSDGGDGGGLAYAVDDAQELSSLDDGSFDGVTCQLALMDIPDLGRTLAAVRRVLRPGGWFVFVIGHPCFLVPEARPAAVGDRLGVTVTGYFDERFWRSANPNGVRRAGNHHRQLCTYLNAAVAAGFTIAAVAEPPAGPLLATQNPLYTEVPIFFAARLTLAAGGAPA